MLPQKHFWLMCVLMTGLVSACGPSPVPTPTVVLLFATPTPGAAAVISPSPSPLPVDSVTPLPAATPTAAATSTPANTATPTITPTPTQTGPPTATPTPHAVINSPGGQLNVRLGPGVIYDPPLGAYSNGAVVEVLGKQNSPEGELWWLIPFAGGRGWIYAAHTQPQNVDNVPWITAPPPPPTATPTLPPTPQAVINSPDGFLYVRGGPGAEYLPPLGAYQNGFVVNIIGKQYAADHELWWLIPFPGTPAGSGWLYADHTIARNANNVPWVTAPPTPTPTVSPTPGPGTPDPIVTWTVSGRVVRLNSAIPVVEAQVEAVLGDTGEHVQTRTGANGEFFVQGQAPNTGSLTVTVTAAGYQPVNLSRGPASPRAYTLPDIQLTPLVADCRYESVMDVSQPSGLSRLASLGFTSVITYPIPVIGDPTLIDLILVQEPSPPPPDQLVKLSCDLPITLGVGVAVPGD